MNVVKPGDDSESEIWERRLTEYLEHLRVDRSYKDVTISTKDNILGRWITYALAHGHSPVVLDKTALKGFLDNPKFKTQKDPQLGILTRQGLVCVLG